MSWKGFFSKYPLELWFADKVASQYGAVLRLEELEVEFRKRTAVKIYYHHHHLFFYHSFISQKHNSRRKN